jgi:hypothetical protein
MSDNVGRGSMVRPLKWVLSNGPAVITVLGSAALAVAGSVIELKEMQLLQGLLALLALVGTSLLTERIVEGRALRSSLGGIEDRLDKVLTYARDIETRGFDALITRRRHLPPLEDRLDGAISVRILGGSLFRLMNEYQKLFESLASEGCDLRFVIANPESEATSNLSMVVVYESQDVETYKSQLKSSYAALISLSSRFPGRCTVRLCNFAPAFSIMAVEKGGSADFVQVELYPYKIPARERPILMFTKERDPKFYAMFCDQFCNIWNVCGEKQKRDELAKIEAQA